MPYEMNQDQFDQVVALPAPERYAHFISRVADRQELWTLETSDGFVQLANDAGEQCVPVWPHPDYAAALATDLWADAVPHKLTLAPFMAKWIPGMIGDNRMVAVFPSPEEKGVVVDPRKLEKDLLTELEQYE
jgi:hypothetical protein